MFPLQARTSHQPEILQATGISLSFRQMRANASGNFKSVTGSTTTPSGQRQRVALLTNATPILQDTRLRIVASFAASWTMRGLLSPPTEHFCISRQNRSGFRASETKQKHPLDVAPEIPHEQRFSTQQIVSAGTLVPLCGKMELLDYNVKL